MITDTRPMPAEHLHSKRCQAAPLGAFQDRRPVFVYARKSRTGVGAYITRENQHGAVTSYAHSVFGPDVPIVYFWDNASGYNETARRPDWDDMLRRIRAGEARAVAAWHVDRYTRIPEIGEHLWKATKASSTQLHTLLGGHITSALAYRILMAQAADESDIKSARQKLKQDQLARDGLPGGGSRAYGWNKDRSAVIPAEKAHVEWVADQLLAGRSLSAITRELNEKGARTATGKEWRQGNLGAFMRKPALAGLREQKGAIVGKASWEPLLSEGKWTAVKALLEDPARRVAKRAPRVYLLSGIARCGTCGGPMRGRSNASKGRQPGYFCDTTKRAGCAYRDQRLMDLQVTADTIARLAQMDATGALSAPDNLSEADTLRAEIQAVEDNLRALGAMAGVGPGKISAAVLAGASEAAEAETARLQAQLDTVEVSKRQPLAVLEGIAGAANVSDIWHGRTPLPSGETMTLERQRAIVALLWDITVQPAGPHARGHAPYNPELVQVVPREL